MTLDGLRMARHQMFFDDAKARRELGYASRPYREGSPTQSPGFAPMGVFNDRHGALSSSRSASGLISCWQGMVLALRRTR